MRSDYSTLVTDLVRDRDQVISADQLDAAITAAVEQYSADQPRPVVVDQVSAGGGSLLDFPAGWLPESELVSAEYPIGNLPPIYLPLSDISTYSTPTGQQLLLPEALAAGDAVRITYTAKHLLDGADDTIPTKHRRAVASFAASILCGQLASYYASESESTISADTVNRQTKAATWRQRARDLAADYNAVVGAAPSDRQKAASVTVAPDRTNALGGRRLFHPTRIWPVPR